MLNKSLLELLKPTQDIFRRLWQTLAKIQKKNIFIIKNKAGNLDINPFATKTGAKVPEGAAGKGEH